MAAKKFTVTHPDGTVSKRSSQSREYTHAVVEAVQRQYFVDQAQERVDDLRKHIANLQEALKADHLDKSTTPWAFGGTRTSAYLGGQYVTAWNDAEGEPAQDLSLEDAREIFETRIKETRVRLAQALARVEQEKARPEISYGAVRWSSSEALALKAANGEFAPRSRYITVTVKPVD